MRTNVINTSKFLIKKICFILLVVVYSVGWTSITSRGGDKRGWYKGPESVRNIIFLGLLCMTLLLILFAVFIDKTIGSIEFTNGYIIIEKIKKRFRFQNGKLNVNDNSCLEKLTYEGVFSIQLLLDSGKDKPIYVREYFKGAENNWLIIKMRNGKTYKIEILIDSLEMENNLINYLENLKEKNIQISYGTKRKTFLHAIRCAF